MYGDGGSRGGSGSGWSDVSPELSPALKMRGAWLNALDATLTPGFAVELLLPASGGEAVAGRKGERGRMWRVDVGLEEIAGSVPGMGAVIGRWCREI